MDWFNYYGLVVMVIIMIPNIIYAVKNKDGFDGAYNNKVAQIAEQIGRYGCIAFMIFNIPCTYFGFYFENAIIVYIAVNTALLLAYCLSWIILWKKRGLVKALLLSVIPSVIFLFSSVMILSGLLFAFAVIFASAHILISVKTL